MAFDFAHSLYAERQCCNDCEFLVQKLWNDGFDNTPFVYAELGKRFQMTRSGSFSLAPTITWLANGRDTHGCDSASKPRVELLKKLPFSA